MNNEYITTKQFVQLIWDSCKGTEVGEVMTYAREHMWVMEQDLCAAEEPIERRRAAYIIHEFLRLELGEPDEESWLDAEKMKDIYDCRACANHIAQVYVKGIMEARKIGDIWLFDSLGQIEFTEAEKIVTSVTEKNLRAKINGAV